jgi:hypothetical protein
MSWNYTALPKVRVYTKSISSGVESDNPFYPSDEKTYQTGQNNLPKRFAGSQEFQLLSYAQRGEEEKLKNLKEELESRFNPFQSLRNTYQSILDVIRGLQSQIAKTIRNLIQIYEAFARIIDGLWWIVETLFLPFKISFYILKAILKLAYSMITFLISPR